MEFYRKRIRLFNHTGFNAYLAEHKLMGARCTCCNRLYLPPREICSNCYCSKMEWIEFSGMGELSGFTTIHVGLPAMIAAGFNRQKPYCTGIVRLSEGPSISGLIVGENNTNPDEISVGLPLQAVFIGRDPEGQVSLGFEKRGKTNRANIKSKTWSAL